MRTLACTFVRTLACAIFALLAGCSRGPLSDFVPSSARSAIVVTFGQWGLLDVLRVQPPVELPLDDAVVDAWVLEYDVEPEMLPYATMAPRRGDPDGVLWLVPSQLGEPDAVRLATPRGATRVPYDYALFGALGARLPIELEDVRLLRAECPTFDHAWSTLEAERYVTFALPVDTERAIVGLDGNCLGGVCSTSVLGELGPRGAIRVLEAPVLRESASGSIYVGLFAHPLGGGAAELSVVRGSNFFERRRLTLEPLSVGPVDAVETLAVAGLPPLESIDNLLLGAAEDWAIVEADGVKRVIHRARGGAWTLVSSGSERGVAVRSFCDVGFPIQFLTSKGPGRAWVGAMDQPIAEATPSGLGRRLLDDEPACRASYVRTADGLDVLFRNTVTGLELDYAWSADGVTFSEARGTGNSVRAFAPLGSGVLAMLGKDVVWLDTRSVRLGLGPRFCPITFSPDPLWIASAAPDGVVLSGRGRVLWIGAVDR